MDSILFLPAGVLAVTNIVFACLAALNWYRAEVAQRELARLVARQERAAGYDTGLVELRKVPEIA